MKPIKRFVAGAVCPRCGAMDKLRVWRDETKEFRECVQCEYLDAMRLDGRTDPEELETRVNQEKPVPKAPGEQVLTFMPMKSSAAKPKKTD
ncbi:MAG: putative metal-binding protein (TIGR02443 family) [Motiliproteus sp.]|jgi:uncharacterized metal-binding protein (TIGR02443 family)